MTLSSHRPRMFRSSTCPLCWTAWTESPCRTTAGKRFRAGMHRLVVRSTLKVRCNESAWLNRRLNDVVDICCRPVRVGQEWRHRKIRAVRKPNAENLPAPGPRPRSWRDRTERPGENSRRSPPVWGVLYGFFNLFTDSYPSLIAVSLHIGQGPGRVEQGLVILKRRLLVCTRAHRHPQDSN